MKKYHTCVIILLVLLSSAGCRGKGPKTVNFKNTSESQAVPDTGFTGIKKYLSGQIVVKEVTFKNGVRQGITKTYYAGGQLFQTFLYENGMKEDSGRWFYLEGQLFRTTPYRHDTIDGIQKQFYRTGNIKAKIGYSKGMRTKFFQEFTPEGKVVGSYPSILFDAKDEYATRGLYSIKLSLSDRSADARFYRGDFTGERFDTSKCHIIRPVNGSVMLTLRKSGTSGQNYIGVIAAIPTSFGNKYLEYKKIDLPYNDLK
ncbi:MAG: hypothetical protein ABSG89_10240 [Bacteroidales bacterium]|jgi:hypothetical protein